ncbi:Elongation factor 1-gamma [Vulpes lagopus]
MPLPLSSSLEPTTAAPFLESGSSEAFPLSPDWQVDYESYTWWKLDPGIEETQMLVQEYFSWEGAFQHVGKTLNQGKIFK